MKMYYLELDKILYHGWNQLLESTCLLHIYVNRIGSCEIYVLASHILLQGVFRR